MSVSCGCCVLSGSGFCIKLISHPEKSYQVWWVWMWLWSLNNEETLAHWGLLWQGGGINQLNVIYFCKYTLHTLEILVIKAQQLSSHPVNQSLEAHVSVSENYTFGLLMTLILWQMTLSVTWRQCNPQWHGYPSNSAHYTTVTTTHIRT